MATVSTEHTDHEVVTLSMEFPWFTATALYDQAPYLGAQITKIEMSGTDFDKLQVGDIVRGVGGDVFASLSEFYSLLRLKQGPSVAIYFFRAGQAHITHLSIPAF